MFTAAFTTAMLKLAIPALTAIISMSMSKYLEKKDKIALSMIIQLVSLGGLFVFYLLPQLDLLSHSLSNLFHVGDLPAASIDTGIDMPASLPTDAPVLSHDTTDIKYQQVTPENSTVYHLKPDQNGYYTKLPYTDYFTPPKPLDMTPLYKDAAESTARLLRPTIDVIKDMPQCELNTWGHIGEFLHGGLATLKDVLLR